MMIRKSALALIGLTVVTTAAGFMLLRNSLIESQMEDLLTEQFKARSDIRDLNLDPFGLEGGLSGLEIADRKQPMQNLIQTGKAEVDVAGWSLLRGSLVFATLNLKDLQLDAPRKTSGALPGRKAPVTPSATKESPPSPTSEPVTTSKQEMDSAPATTPAPSTPVATEPEPSSDQGNATASSDDSSVNWKKLNDNLPRLDLAQASKQLNIPDLTQGLELQSVKQIQQAKQQNRNNIDSLKAELENDDLDKRIADTRAQIIALKARKITDIKSAEKALKDAQAINKNIAAINADYKKIRSESDRLIKNSKLHKNQLGNSIRDDINTMKQLANIRNINTKDIAIILFGQATMQKIQQVMDYANLAMKYMPESDDEEPVSRRSGRDIRFPVTTGYEPYLLVKNLAFNGSKGARQFAGKITNFSSNPIRYRQPVSLSLNSSVNRTDWQLSSVFHAESDARNTVVTLTGDHIKSQQIKLSDKKDPSNPSQAIFKDSNVLAKLDIGKQGLSGTLKLDASKLNLSFAEKARTRFDREIQNALSKPFNNVVLEARLSGSLSNPGLSVKTNIDQQLSRRLKAVVGEKVAQANRQLENHVTRSVAKELNIANNEIENYSKPVKNILTGKGKAKDELAALQKQAENNIKSQLNKYKRAQANKLKKQTQDKLKKSLKGLKF